MDTISRLKWPRLVWALGACGCVFVLFLVFDAGFALGVRHSREMRDPRGMYPPPQNVGFGQWGVPVPHGFMPEGHGAIGTIQSIALPTITIQTRDGDTKEILVTNQTHIQGATSSQNQNQLRVGQQVAAIGEPGTTTEDRLTAAFIRILPPPPQQ